MIEKKKTFNRYSVKIENLSKSYKANNKEKRMVFENLNILFEKGKIHCILGISGCGKSTLLRIIAGLEQYDEGKVLLIDNSDKKDNTFLSMILQDNNLLPWLTIYKNIKFVMKATGNEDVTPKEINELLKIHNLIEYKDFYPFELSVGQKQKVALAKAIVTKPKVVLLDEPFCALDFVSKSIIHELFLKEFKKEKFTSILSTHYVEEAIKLGDYIHLLGKDNNYKKFKNPLKSPRDNDIGYQKFLDFIINEYM